MATLKRIGIALIVAAVAGSAYQWAATLSDERSYPPTGQLVEVGGRRVHIDCQGEGSPTVILEAGAFGSAAEWYWLQQQLAPTNRACAYDRAGMGASAPGPAPRTSLQLTAELHALLQAAGIQGPYVLAGHSMGGVHSRVYTMQFPRDVLGLVLVDPALLNFSFPDEDAYLQWKRSNDVLNAPIWAIIRTGLARWSLNSPTVYQGFGYPPPTASRIAAARNRNQSFDTYYAEGIAAAMQNSRQSAAAVDLGSRPLIVLWATVLPRELAPAEAQTLAGLQQEVGGYSSNSLARYVEGASHGSIIGSERYSAEVSAAIREVIRSARSGQPLAQ